MQSKYAALILPMTCWILRTLAGIKIISMASTGATGMHAVFKPGCVWEKDEKPLLGHPDTGPMNHTGCSLSGTMVVRMFESGIETTIKPGDLFETPPGHDAFVQGDDPVELILFAAPEHSH